ncbi:hypothetical protein G6F22_020378 [Rhizopus arrhizus]|nr:hypothetical protein G6F22_020378 [Rhizopus arrhizus]
MASEIDGSRWLSAMTAEPAPRAVLSSPARRPAVEPVKGVRRAAAVPAGCRFCHACSACSKSRSKRSRLGRSTGLTSTVGKPGRMSFSPSGVTLTALRVGKPLKATKGGTSRPSTASTAARPIGPRFSTTSMKLPAANAKANGTDS